MAIAAHETRDEKLNWLLRPFDWALRVCLSVLGLCALAGINRDISTETVASVTVVTLAVVVALLVWGVSRVTDAARGRAGS